MTLYYKQIQSLKKQLILEKFDSGGKKKYLSVKYFKNGILKI